MTEPPAAPLTDPSARCSRPGGKRWRGSLGPSLFMTAIESAPPSCDTRREREAAGRHIARVLRMTAEQRAQNDLPPPASVREGMEDPGTGMVRLMVEAAAEDLAQGPSELCRENAARRLVQLGAIPPVALRPTEPIGRAIAEAIRRPLGASGFAALLREFGSRLSPDLVSRAKSHVAPSAHGFRGLTASGRRCIRDACALLAEMPGQVGFGTITLPDADAETCTRDQLARFQSAWMQYAREGLRRVGLPPLVVMVAELHPKRRLLSGAPVLHWHYAYVGRADPQEAWRLGKADWHRFIRWAWSAAFGHPRPHTFGCKVEAARKDPGRYLSKYLSKTRSDCERFRGTENERCIPKQWWAWTGELRTLTLATRCRPPAAFLRWCVRWRNELQCLGECLTGPVQLGEGGPVVGAWFGWASTEALDRAIDGWIAAEFGRLDAAGLGIPWKEAPPPDPSPVST